MIVLGFGLDFSWYLTFVMCLRRIVPVFVTVREPYSQPKLGHGKTGQDLKQAALENWVWGILPKSPSAPYRKRGIPLLRTWFGQLGTFLPKTRSISQLQVIAIQACFVRCQVSCLESLGQVHLFGERVLREP